MGTWPWSEGEYVSGVMNPEGFTDSALKAHYDAPEYRRYKNGDLVPEAYFEPYKKQIEELSHRIWKMEQGWSFRVGNWLRRRRRLDS